MTLELSYRWRVDRFDDMCTVCGEDTSEGTATLIKKRASTARPKDGVVQDLHLVTLCYGCLQAMLAEVTAESRPQGGCGGGG